MKEKLNYAPILPHFFGPNCGGEALNAYLIRLDRLPRHDGLIFKTEAVCHKIQEVADLEAAESPRQLRHKGAAS